MLRYNCYDNSFKTIAVELGALPGVQEKDVVQIVDIHTILQLIL